ncbi:hypothetical protein HanRHA438_Chr08g0363781 [Helianthus annuus]|nr:hypothetical protein HanRHA438_Chr08g0363781 [Helianthus annuus]
MMSGKKCTIMTKGMFTLKQWNERCHCQDSYAHLRGPPYVIVTLAPKSLL